MGQAARALDNDRVLVEVVPSGAGRTAGRIVKVLAWLAGIALANMLRRNS